MSIKAWGEDLSSQTWFVHSHKVPIVLKRRWKLLLWISMARPRLSCQDTVWKIHVFFQNGQKWTKKPHLDLSPFLVNVGIKEFVNSTTFVRLSCSSVYWPVHMETSLNTQRCHKSYKRYVFADGISKNSSSKWLSNTQVDRER